MLPKAKKTAVYLVRFKPPGILTVEENGESVPMEQFLQTHNPIQVTSLTHVAHGGSELTVVGLMIAEGGPAPAQAKTPESHGSGRKREILKAFS